MSSSSSSSSSSSPVSSATTIKQEVQPHTLHRILDDEEDNARPVKKVKMKRAASKITRIRARVGEEEKVGRQEEEEEERGQVDAAEEKEAAEDGEEEEKEEGAHASTSLVDSSTLQQFLDERAEKRRRLARKAELARMSRAKKKSRSQVLEAQLESLHAEIAEMQANTKFLLDWRPSSSSSASSSSSFASSSSSLSDPSASASLSSKNKSKAPVLDSHSSELLPESYDELLRLLATLPMSAESPTSSVSTSSLSSTATIAESNSRELQALLARIHEAHRTTSTQLAVHLQQLERDVTISASSSSPLQQLSQQISKEIDGGFALYEKLNSICSPEQMRKLLLFIQLHGEVAMSVR